MMEQPKEVYNAFADPAYWAWLARGAKRIKPAVRKSMLRPTGRQIIIKILARLSFEQVAEIGRLVTDDLRSKLDKTALNGPIQSELCQAQSQTIDRTKPTTYEETSMKPEDTVLHKENSLPIGCSEAKAKLSIEDAYLLWKQGKLRTEQELREILPRLK